MPGSRSLRFAVVLLPLAAACESTAVRGPAAAQTAPDAAVIAACVRCHGDLANGNAAPPISVRGATATTDISVGAHQAHLHDGALRKAIACAECHVVPPDADITHIGKDHADLTWGPLAGARGVAPSSAAGTDTGGNPTITCTNYCHGATLAGGANTRPAWTLGASQAACGTCHGVPPPASTGHPPVPAGIAGCAACHPGTIGADGIIDTAGGKHINGILEVAGGSCTSCHGGTLSGGTGASGANPVAAAPPRDASGNTAATARGVGAHAVHLLGGSTRTALQCSDCHTVPGDSAHSSLPVNLTWSPLARAAGVTPTYATATQTCTNYCHGATLSGGSRTSPVWTGGAAQAACGTCHGLPPTTGHPAVSGGVTACATCHPGTVRSDGTIDLAGGKHVNGTVDVAGQTCTSCHGGTLTGGTGASGVNPVAAAPPRDTAGNAGPSAPGVGAHAVHLTGGTLRGALVCSECHVVPSSTAHANSAVDLAWGALARTGGVTPAWNGAALTCTNYCHGATLSGGSGTSPAWTGGAAQAACGTCHGLPPSAGGHPAVTGGVTACATCHPATVRSNGTIDVAGGRHVNGTVDVVSLSCTSCHGGTLTGGTGATGANPVAAAPPRDTAGNTATSAPGVGAHAKHLQGGVYRAALACNDCHTVPGSSAHASQPLDLTWGTLARVGGVTPAWNGAALTCTNYCHGATLSGGSGTSPVWTGGAAQAACGTCHGLPPTAGGHPAVTGGITACATCHPGTVLSNGTIDVAGGRHVNGAVEVATLSCTSCHGGTLTGGTGATGANPVAAAPPRDTAGNTATSAPGVGAHAKHLVGGVYRAAMACNDCHTVPGSSAHASQPLDLTWGTLARADGVTPAWNGTTLTCTNYCHGATLAGGSGTSPAWTGGAAQAACGTCHGLPPTAGGHPAVSGGVTVCATCHPGTVRADGTIDVAGGKHVNGVVDIAALSCTSCHGGTLTGGTGVSGSNPVAAAPPRDTAGNTATSAPGVGAHAKHLLGGSYRSALACNDCHVVPSDSAHASQPLDLTWGALARSGSVTPSFNGTGLTCTNYCHGATLSGGSQTTPTWTGGAAQAACGTCHGLPPTAGGHPAVTGGVTACAGCHPATVLANGSIDVAGGRHVNGVVDVAATLGCTSCHGGTLTGGTGTSGANPVAAAPPRDTAGNTATSAPGVGAHQAHLYAGPLSGAFECAQCHTVPTTSAHSSQPLNLTWGALPRTGGVTPTWNGTALTCTNYCHGAGLTGGTRTSPVWTGGAAQVSSCSSCHGNPPNTGRHSKHVSGEGIACATCHSGYTGTTVNVAVHVNGTRQATAPGWNSATRSCNNSCHGTENWGN